MAGLKPNPIFINGAYYCPTHSENTTKWPDKWDIYGSLISCLFRRPRGCRIGRTGAWWPSSLWGCARAPSARRPASWTENSSAFGPAKPSRILPHAEPGWRGRWGWTSPNSSSKKPAVLLKTMSARRWLHLWSTSRKLSVQSWYSPAH